MDIIIFLTDGDPRDPNGPDKIRQVIADGNSKLVRQYILLFNGLHLYVISRSCLNIWLSIGKMNLGTNAGARAL